MTNPAQEMKDCAPGPCSRRISYDEPAWYAVHTSSRHEKRVHDVLLNKAVEAFFPTYNEVRRWNKRKVSLDLPLFPGYLFAKISLQDRLRVLQVPGVAKILGSLSSPTPVPPEEIQALQLAAASGYPAQPHTYLAAGKEVRIKSGPFEHLTGILVRRRSSTRVVISIHAITQSFAVEVDVSEVEVIRTPGRRIHSTQA